MSISPGTPAPHGLFVTGTDTAVGKTQVTAGIARVLTRQGRRVGVLKPVATGVRRTVDGWHCEDAEILRSAIGGEVPLPHVVPIVFEAPLAPPVAARLEGVPLTFADVWDQTRLALAWWVRQGVEAMLIEGVGGWLCPLAEGATVADLAVALDYPVLIVARRGLGTLNHTLLTVEAVHRRGLRIAGIILNGAEPTSHPRRRDESRRTASPCSRHPLA